MELWQIDIGDIVVCDICNMDYTNSKDRGGFISGGYAICPKCEKHTRLNDVDYISRPDESFKDFVVRTRKHSTVGMCSW